MQGVSFIVIVVGMIYYDIKMITDIFRVFIKEIIKEMNEKGTDIKKY